MSSRYIEVSLSNKICATQKIIFNFVSHLIIFLIIIFFYYFPNKEIILDK